MIGAVQRALVAACMLALVSGSAPPEAVAQGMTRKQGETSEQCVRRIFPNGYNVRNLQQCVQACYHCYTKSGGATCEPYCRGRQQQTK